MAAFKQTNHKYYKTMLCASSVLLHMPECLNVNLAYFSLQVEVEVESMDKGGNFIGWVVVEGVNLSVALVEEGLAKVHFTAERTNHYKALLQAEAKAKEKRLNVSGNFSCSIIDITTSF